MATHAGSFDDVEVVRADAAIEAVVPAADPAILGMPVFTLGSIALGLALVGFIPGAALGGVMPILFAATGLGVFTSALWAMSLGQTMLAGVFGIFGSFWLSYSALVLGLTHGWYGVPAVNVTHVEGLFLISWTVIFISLTVSTLRLPLAFTTLFALVDVAFVFLIIGTLGTSTAATHIGGVVVLAFAANGLYLFIHGCDSALGGKGLPLGNALLR